MLALLSLVLAGAPLSFTDGAFLGFSTDGHLVWRSTFDNRAEQPPRRVTVVTVRSPLATEETFELETGPIGGPLTAGADVAKWEAWKAAHALVKPTSAPGVETAMRVDGKPATRWGGTGKAVKLELVTRRLGVTHTGRSQFADAFGKKLGTTTGEVFVDPSGRRAVFVLMTEPTGAEPATGELVEVAAGPTVFLWYAPGTPMSAVDARVLEVERLGFSVSGQAESPQATKGLTVVSSAKVSRTAETLAKALGASARVGRVDASLGEVALSLGAP